MNTIKRLQTPAGFVAILWVMFLGSLSITPASAAPVTFNFAGTVTSVGSSLGASPFGSGPILLSGSYTFTPPTPNTGTGSPIATYNNTISNLTFQLGTYSNTPGTITPNSIIVANNFLGGDAYLVASRFSGPAVNGRNPLAFEIDLLGNSNAFANNSLPTTPPSLSSFTTQTFRILFTGGGHTLVLGTLTSLTAVPLPTAILLFGAGLVALVGLGAGSWRQRKSRLA